jgi:hypothetical protein
LFQLIKIAFAIAIAISYNLQFIVAANIIWTYFSSISYIKALANESSSPNVSLTITNTSSTINTSDEDEGGDQTSEEDEKKKTKDLSESEISDANSEANLVLNTVKTKSDFNESNMNIWRKFMKKYSISELDIIENIVKTSLLILTFVLAILIPRIDLFISLIGAIASSTLALIIPPLLDLVMFWPESNFSKIKLFKNVAFIIFGIGIFGFGSFFSIKDIINYFIKGNSVQ